MKLLEAIQAWESTLTPEYVRTSPEYLRQMETATFQTTARVLAVLFPPDRDTLQKCVRIANQYKTPIYPIAQGMNYGYGSRVPVCEQSVIIDLSRMNRILDFDPIQGVLTVEPGVTFQQAMEFLRAQGTTFTLAGTGAPPKASLIGNSIERGIGKGLGSNRIDHICNFEVVLPTGESFSTGLGRFDNAKGKALTKWGPGPFFDGIFTQSNFGILTRMSFWLTPVPEHFQTFIFTVQNEEKLPLIINALHGLKQKEILRSSATLFNSYRTLGFLGKFPWDLHAGNTTLPEELALRALKRYTISAYWYGDGALYSNSRAQARAERKLVKKALKGLVSNLTFFYEPKVTVLTLVSNVFNKISKHRQLPSLDLFFKKSPYAGHLVPAVVTLGSTYFRMKSERPSFDKMEPNQDQCGTYWIGPIVPFDGGSIEMAVKLIKAVITRHGLEPAMTLQLVSARQIDVIVSISFDRTIPGEDQRAKECHDELLQELSDHGLYPYRLGIQSQAVLPAPDDDYCFFIEKIKKALDPNDILAPGRYDFRSHWGNRN